jgi:hypothetical protein
MASFEAAGGELFKEEHITFSEEEPENGQFYIAVDLAGFADVQKVTTKTNDLTKRQLRWLGK